MAKHEDYTPGRTDPYLYRWRTIRANARFRRILFDIQLIDIVSIWNGKCKCCSKTIYIMNYTDTRGDWSALDRKDNTKGYIKGNIAWICQRCNYNKRNMTVIDINLLYAYIHNHSIL